MEPDTQVLTTVSGSPLSPDARLDGGDLRPSEVAREEREGEGRGEARSSASPDAASPSAQLPSGPESKKKPKRPRRPNFKPDFRLTPRDGHIIATLAIARYLSTAQLRSLFFAGKSEEAARRRLAQMEARGVGAAPKPYLRRLQYRTLANYWVYVWTPSSLGYLVAEDVLGYALEAPPADVGPSFLEHSVQLSQLFVALARGEGPPNPRRLGFGWRTSDSARQPWAEYDAKSGKTRPRLIVPDALLELPVKRKRLFLECEMGTHTIEPEGDTKPGSTVAKVERYHQYLFGLGPDGSSTSFYRERFRDGFQPELLLLVTRPSRVASVEKALARWRKGKPPEEAAFARVMTFEAAEAELRGGVPPSATASASPEAVEDFAMKEEASSAPARGRPALPLNDVRLLKRFFNSSITRMKEARAQLRGLGADSLPDYPEGADKVRALVSRLEGLGVAS